jgi:beta-barrel assembly-enhancing protease
MVNGSIYLTKTLAKKSAMVLSPHFLFKRFAPILFLALSGCATLGPYIQDFNLISIPQENELSAQLEAEIKKEMTLVEDGETERRVQSLGERLARGLPRQDFNYRFFIVEDKSPNAFTIPGGAIYVHTGLLQFASQDELTGVLAHEIGHAYERHPTKLLSRAYGVQYIAQLLFKDPEGKMKRLALDLAGGGILARYGQRDEFEADEMGFAILKRTGYPTRGLLTFLAKIQKLGGGAPVPFLSSHPPTPERIARLETLEHGRAAVNI